MAGNVLFDFFDGVGEVLSRIWEAHGLAIGAALIVGLMIGLITKSSGLTSEQQIEIKQLLDSREEAWKREMEERLSAHGCHCCRQPRALARKRGSRVGYSVRG